MFCSALQIGAVMLRTHTPGLETMKQTWWKIRLPRHCSCPKPLLASIDARSHKLALCMFVWKLEITKLEQQITRSLSSFHNSHTIGLRGKHTATTKVIEMCILYKSRNLFTHSRFSFERKNLILQLLRTRKCKQINLHCCVRFTRRTHSSGMSFYDLESVPPHRR